MPFLENTEIFVSENDKILHVTCTISALYHVYIECFLELNNVKFANIQHLSSFKSVFTFQFYTQYMYLFMNVEVSNPDILVLKFETVFMYLISTSIKSGRCKIDLQSASNNDKKSDV